MDTLLARIKPRDPHHGHVLRRFVYRGIRFEEGKGWYEVSAEVGAHLRGVRQRAHDPQAALAFDVCTATEAKDIEVRETEEKKPARPADRARPTEAREAREAREAAGPPPVPAAAFEAKAGEVGLRRGRKEQG
ncbi:MAG: hypothetical protein RBU30_26215 [Polyangia bacterium]|jgi:hypothetical protein|nr:hypothetical protein [Polyangia bacterium]